MRHFLRAALGFLGLTLSCACLIGSASADTALHSLWEVHGKHNTVYLLGSIHVLRASDYPLAPAVITAYSNAKAIYMEVNMEEMNGEAVRSEMLSSAIMPEDKQLPAVLGKERYTHAYSLAHSVGIELPSFDQFAPWFAAEAISQLQLMKLGFQPQTGVEMYFLEKARSDGKSIAGLETIHDQISLFQDMPLDAQADYLISSLEQVHDLPQEVDAMVQAWQRGDTGWFATQIKSELGKDPKLYQSVLVARNKKWVPKIEALLNDNKNYLVIVGTGHLVGQGSVIELLKKDGIGATQL
ncbi:MAG TPA: TraB/GumN family protein [Steroidobacteraceae bacterium]|jgi:hypothetical protein